MKFLRKSWDYGQFSGEDLLKVANLWDRLLDHSAQKKEVRDAWQFLVDQEVSFEEIIVPEE